jgi:hypothetical protein
MRLPHFGDARPRPQLTTMNARTTLFVVAAIAFAAMPTATGNPYGDDCSQPTTYYGFDDVQCRTIAGPGSFTHKSVLGAGIGICTTEAGSPMPCNDPGAPTAGAGAAIFDPNTVYTWVEYLGPCVGAPETCGFEILLCNDRDFDGTCTNISATNDELFSTTSNEALVGGGYLVCTPITVPPAMPCDPVMPTVGGDCADDDKDLKDCGDDLDAEIGACMNPRMQPPAPAAPVPDWNFGQVVVFIGNWVDSWPGVNHATLGTFETNFGAGIAVGHFNVWLGERDGCGPVECNDGVDNADVDVLVDMADDGCLHPALDESED